MLIWKILHSKLRRNCRLILASASGAFVLSRNIDQRAAAGKAGISERALRNLESGKGSTVETLLRTLKALGYTQGIEMLAPETTVDPLALLHRAKPPQRVRRSRKQQKVGL